MARIKVGLSGKLTSADVLAVIKAHIEKTTKRQVTKIRGTCKVRYEDHPCDSGTPYFDGVEFDLEPEDLGD